MKNRDIRIAFIVMICASVIIVPICFFLNIFSGVLSLILAISMISAFGVFVRNRQAKIDELNSYLSLVCSGDYSLDIDDNEEGELSILKNNLYKVVVMLRTSNEALQNDKKYLSDSIADISHQLKTPMTSMMVMADLIKEESNEDRRGEFVSIIENQLNRMKWLVLTLLKLSKLDAGVIDMSRSDVSVCELVNEAIKPFELAMELKNIEYKSSISDFVLNIDRNWTIEAMQNIIKNCIEHTENGELSIATRDTNTYFEIEISDNGCGIAMDDLPHIFERFYHGKNSSSESVGIGLALSKEILTKQNATIDVTSTEGDGTSFSIKFYKSIV